LNLHALFLSVWCWAAGTHKKPVQLMYTDRFSLKRAQQSTVGTSEASNSAAAGLGLPMHPAAIVRTQALRFILISRTAFASVKVCFQLFLNTFMPTD